MKRIIQGCLLLLAALLLPAFAPASESNLSASLSTAEAASQPGVEVAQRELKKDKDYRASDVYARAHHIIYGSKGPVGPGGRTRIAVIVNGDESLVSEDRIKNDIYAQLRKKFPRDSFALMKGTDVNTRLLQMAEDRYAGQHGTATVTENGARVSGTVANTSGTISKDAVRKEDALDADGVPVKIQPRGTADLIRKDLAAAGSAFDYQYVLMVTLTEGHSEFYRHMVWPLPTVTSSTTKPNVWLRVRFVDCASGNYLYRNDIAAKGKSHNGYPNGRAFEVSVHKAMQEALNDIAITED